MPEGDLGTAVRRDRQRDLEIVLWDEVADALLQISQDRERRGLHAAKAPGLPERRRAQPQGDGAGAIEPQVVVFILAAEGLQVGGVIPLAGIRLLGHRREGSADRDLVEGSQLETVYATSVAEVFEHLPGDH